MTAPAREEVLAGLRRLIAHLNEVLKGRAPWDDTTDKVLELAEDLHAAHAAARVRSAARQAGYVYVGDYPSALIRIAADQLAGHVDLDVQEIGRRLRASVEPATEGQSDPVPVERPAPVGSWWRGPGGEVLQVSGDYLDGPGDQIVTYTEYSPDGTVAQGKWGGTEFAAAYTRIDVSEVPDWVEVAW